MAIMETPGCNKSKHAVLKGASTSSTSTVRRRSILKTSNHSTDSESLDHDSSSARRRRHSMTDLAADDERDDRKGNGERQQKAPRRRVSFTSVDINEHHITIGDHPDVSYGVPISLDWKASRRTSIDLEEYEEERVSLRRDMGEMEIPFHERRRILRDAGLSDEEINLAAAEARRVKINREITAKNIDRCDPAFKAKELLQRVSLKMKKMARFSRRSTTTIRRKKKPPNDHELKQGQECRSMPESKRTGWEKELRATHTTPLHSDPQFKPVSPRSA